MAYTNLEYLTTITDGDKPIIREMIEMFLSEITGHIQNLNELYRTGQYMALGMEAHKIKSSLLIMGMKELAEEMNELQLKTAQKSDPKSYHIHIKKFEIHCEAAIIELQAELSSL